MLSGLVAVSILYSFVIIPAQASLGNGRSGVSKQNFRIVGGADAKQGEFPFMVALTYKVKGNTSNSIQFCGGTLIAKNYVLTAAHCVDGIRQQNTSGNREAFIQFGQVSKKAWLEKNSRNIERFIVHEHYTSTVQSGDNDIALAKFTGDVPTGFEPVWLPQQEISYVDKALTVIGWGSIVKLVEKNVSQASHHAATVLQKATVPGLRHEYCSRQYPPNDPEYKYNPNTMICAGHLKGGADQCSGDSGGPLLVAHNGKTTQIGIVSWNKGCGIPNYPGVYTRTAVFIPWIKSKVEGADLRLN